MGEVFGEMSLDFDAYVRLPVFVIIFLYIVMGCSGLATGSNPSKPSNCWMNSNGAWCKVFGA